MSFNFGVITTAPCENVLPPFDTNCSDPAYRLAHPDLCPIQPTLIIKPAIALICQLKSVQFKAFIVQNGAEVDVTSSSTFTSSDLGTAWVGVKSGNATGVAAGIASVVAHYQDQTASAELNVMGCTGNQCDSTVAMLLLIDTSKSMSQAFSSSKTKLTYAKGAAADFATTINTTKDLVGAMRFNAASTVLVDAPISDGPGVAADIAGIGQTQQLTTFHDAFVAAVAELDATTADLKVLILVSDGEDTTASYTDENNPLIPIQAFKAAGGIVMCLGVRAHDAGFNFLEAVSTGGFFINAYAATESVALGYLEGLRGYICAGNCTPAGDVIEHDGKSCYVDFINWDVTQGKPDILGNGFYDVLPGNGLYVDLRGSGDYCGDFSIPILQSKDAFSLVSGHTYRLAIDLAGNQVVSRPGDTVAIRVFSGSVNVLSQQIALSDYTQDFHTYSFSFTPSADMDVKIEIQQTNDTGTALGGVLVNRVRFDDMTDLTSLLDDNFDDENAVYVPPRCGTGSIYYNYQYAHGYDCYGIGCLDTPPPVQLSDPSPLADIESGFTPPVIYSSTRTACADCGNDGINLSTVNLIPAMTSPTEPSGVASASGEDATYQAYGAFDGNKPVGGGIPQNQVWDLAGPSFPVWLQYDFPAAQTVRHYEVTGYGNSSGFGSPPKDWTFQGSNDGSTWTDLDTVAGANFFSGETKKYLVDTPSPYLSYRLLITAGKSAGYVGVIELAMFAAGEQSICQTASYDSSISQVDADTRAYQTALDLAEAELNCQHIYSSTQQFTAHCSFGLFPTTRSATATSLNSQDEADADAVAAAKVLAEAALNCGQSTNGQQIAINDNTTATPYPSVKNVSIGGTIAKVTVSLTGINHFFSFDIAVLLVSPSGTQMLLMANSGNAPLVNVDLVFDQDAGSPLPTAAPITSGTWRPNGQPLVTDFPSPTVARPPAYETSLNAFIGENPDGLWALFILDDAAGSAGTLDSWDLTIT